MCRWPWFYGPAVQGAIAPVIAPDSWTQEVGVRKTRLYTKPSGGAGISGGTFLTTGPTTPSSSWVFPLASVSANTSDLTLDTGTHKVTVPAGVNHIAVSGQLAILSGASGTYYVYVKVNGTTKASGGYTVGDVTLQQINTQTVVLAVSEGDEITLEGSYMGSATPSGYASGYLTVFVMD